MQRDRFSLSIRPLGVLVDMFHTRKATVALDKVYALLGMSSDDPSAAGLSADYNSSWETVFRKLVIFSLSSQISVETWDKKEVAVIRGKSYILGEVSEVEGDTITWKDTPKGRSQSFTLPASAKPNQPRDILCLFHGASRPTIIRAHSDYAAVIRITVPSLDDSDAANTAWLERLESVTTFPDDFLLVWDWEVPQDRVQAKEYEDFRNGQGLSDPTSQQQKDPDRAARLWTMGRVLECVGRYEEAGERFQKSVDMGAMVLDSGHASWAAWGDLLVEDRSGWAPLLYAAKKGYEAIVRQLLDKEAVVGVDRFGWTSLLWAAGNGHEGVVRQLLEKSVTVNAEDRFGWTPLSWAARNGHKGVIRQLLEKGAMVGEEDQFGRTPLLWAARNGHKGVLQQLLEKGAMVEAKDNVGRTPLSWAAGNGHEGVVRQLLEKGAIVEAEDRFGQTPLSWAAGNGYEGVVQRLLEEGAIIEVKGPFNRYAEYPLAQARGGRFEDITSIRAEVGVEDRFGRTPLSRAAGNGHKGVVRQLLERGAMVEVEDELGRTPLSWAAEKGHAGVVQLLEEGARRYRIQRALR